MKTPHITVHTFADCEGNKIKVPAPTVEQSHNRISNHDGRYTYKSSEEIPYTHAPLAMAVAKELGDEWKATPISDENKDCNWYLTRTDGLQLFLSAPGWNHKGKWSISFNRPRHDGSFLTLWEGTGNNKVADPSINVAETKSPEQIAKDIKRRMLADCEKVQALAMAQVASYTESANKRVASALRIAKIFGKNELESKYQGKPGEKRTSGYFKGGEWEAHEGGSVTFGLRSLTIEQAEKIAAVCATF